MKEYPRTTGNKEELEKLRKALSKKEAEAIKSYIILRKARGLKTQNNLTQIENELMKDRHVFNKSLVDNITIKDFQGYLSIIGDCGLSKNFIKKKLTDLKGFLKMNYKDWSDRFSEFQDITILLRNFGNGKLNQEKINHETIFTKEEIEKMISAENKTFWKTFLIVQYEAGLRTIETRLLKWENIKFLNDGFAEINVYATKTHKARTIYVKEATKFLKQLQNEQRNSNELGIYVFHSRKDNKNLMGDKNFINKPIQKNSVNKWFSKLSQRVLGRKGWNYLLRHSRSSELYNLSKLNKISKDVVIEFMGHSEDMSGTYTHISPEKIKEMLKSQIYNVDNTPQEEKNKIELELAGIKEENSIMNKKIDMLEKLLVERMIKT